jgi:hypothetical protein
MLWWKVLAMLCS